MDPTVYGVLVFEWVQTGLLTAASFNNYVYNYGNVDKLVSISNSWFSVSVMSATIALVVQLFYAWRIQRLSGSRVLSGMIVFVSGQPPRTTEDQVLTTSAAGFRTSCWRDCVRCPGTTMIRPNSLRPLTSFWGNR